jgi:hypothetical protein
MQFYLYTKSLSQNYRTERNQGLCIFQYIGEMLKQVMKSQWHNVVHKLTFTCYCSSFISQKYKLKYSAVPLNYTQVYLLKSKES